MAKISALELVVEFCERMNLPVPTALIGSTEKSIRQYRAILKDAVRDLLEFRWQEQRITKTFLSTNVSTLQGKLATIIGADYLSLVPNTLWNADRKMQIYGPVSDQVWAAIQVLPNGGPEYQCWISQDSLYISPIPGNVENHKVIYESAYGIVDATEVTAKEYITVDTDKFLFPNNVLMKAFSWRWAKIKGRASWEDDYNDYISLVARNKVKSGAPMMNLDSPTPNVRPGIVIPAGSWNV